MNFGSIAYDEQGRRWLLALAPHVMIRAKRVFGKVRTSAQGVLTLSDTIENARDLEWFLERYPMTLERGRYLAERAQAFREKQTLVDELLSKRRAMPAFDLALPLREYQKTAASLLLARGSMLLADDVGLGKTASLIGAFTDPRALPALVVTLTHLPKQWEREINRFAPKLTTHILKKGTPYDIAGAMKKGRGPQLGLPAALPDVIITNYHKLSGWAGTLAPLIGGIFFDEIQELRHHDSAKYEAARHLASHATIRAGASATPIFNYGAELQSVLAILEGENIGTREEFLREWCHGDRIIEPKAFGAYARDSGMMLRRTRADVGRELPPLVRVPHFIDIDENALDSVSASCAELAKIILAKSETEKGAKFRASEELSNLLRQATGIGKCMAPGTRVIRADGSVDKIENIRVGDALLGPDGQPRRVLSTTSGHAKMYTVSSSSRQPLFEAYVVTGNHVLALKHSGQVRHGDRDLFGPYRKGDHLEISVDEYRTKSKHFRRLLKGYKTGVDYPTKGLSLDPYFLGLWLGDGTSATAAVTTADAEVVSYLRELAARHGMGVRVHQPHRTAPTYCLTPGYRGGNLRAASGRNPVLTALRGLGVLGRKHIPTSYLVNDRRTRMALFAGLVDSDGSLNSSGTGYEIATKWAHLAEEISRLACSLGFAAKTRVVTARNQTGKTHVAHRVQIYGNGLEKVPVLVPRKKATKRTQIKDPLRSGINVEAAGDGPFYGFTLEGDGLYLLHDFTVTHNSSYVADFVRLLVEQGEKVVLYGWHHAVYEVWRDKLADLNPAFYTGKESTPQKEESKRRFLAGEAKVLVMSLRAGAGLDGLQGSCRIVVFGELDWSPGVHEQACGRVHRDGQTESCVAYFLVAESGSDPIVCDVLQLKKEQVEGIRDPNRELVEELQVDPDHVKKLAASWLAQKSKKTEAV